MQGSTLYKTWILNGLLDGLNTSMALAHRTGLRDSHVRGILRRLKAEGLVETSAVRLTKRRGRPAKLWKVKITVDPRQRLMFGGTVNPVELVPKIKDLTEGERSVLTAIAERSRSDQELVAATKMKARVVKDILGALERRRLIEAINVVPQGRAGSVKTWSVTRTLVEQAGGQLAPWRPHGRV